MNSLVALLSVFVALSKCQQKPTVAIHPSQHGYIGDVLMLTCLGMGADNEVKWYFNNQVRKNKSNWILPLTNTDQSGPYHCERNGAKSDSKNMTVSEYLPPSSLTLSSGNRVVLQGDSNEFKLEVENQVTDWSCHRFWNKVSEPIEHVKLEQNILRFHSPKILEDTIFWCEHKTSQERSNSIIIRTTGSRVLLVPPPDLPVLGTETNIKCVVGGFIILQAYFYKDDVQVQSSSLSYYSISKMTRNDMGKYKCKAVYKHKENTSGILRNETSDVQDIVASIPAIKANISQEAGQLVCSCTVCPTYDSSRFYRKVSDGRLVIYRHHHNPATGLYYCRVIWKNGVSQLSDPIHVEADGTNLLVALAVVAVLLLLIGILILATCYRKRRQANALYQEVNMTAMKSDKEEEGNKEGEYATVNFQEEQAEGRYEALNRTTGDGGQGPDGDYHVLNPQETSKALSPQPETEKTEGGYEALKKASGEEKVEVYHTLQAEKGKAEGGYEALKKASGQEKVEVYHTLQAEKGKAEGGYEALKKTSRDEKADVYQTLEKEGEKSAEGRYETLKKAKEQEVEGLYHTLGTDGE